MTTTVSSRKAAPSSTPWAETRTSGFALLFSILALMWLVEMINSLDNGGLDSDGLYARNVGRLWGILTFPFIHASFTHLLDNTVPFLFLGAIIALRGAARLGFITAFVILVGGLGTWLLSPAYPPTVGASGVVFGYAAYLLARGFFDRRLWEIVVGGIVALIWGAALVSSLIPQAHISWQAHLCGGIAGILAAWILSSRDRRARRGGRAPRPPAAQTAF